MRRGFRIEKLRRDHSLDRFTCGVEALDRFLQRHAFASQQANAAQTYLGLHDEALIGFYSLTVGEVARGDAPERLTKGLARHPVPIMLLARLAVAVDWQGRGSTRSCHARDEGRRVVIADARQQFMRNLP